MASFSAAQRAQLRDAAARSRIAAQEESQRLAEAAANERRLARLQLRSARSPLPATPPPAQKKQPAEQHTPDPILDLPEAQPVIARLLAAVGEFNAVDAREHVLRVAADVVRAKKQPRNPYAEATL